MKSFSEIREQTKTPRRDLHTHLKQHSRLVQGSLGSGSAVEHQFKPGVKHSDLEKKIKSLGYKKVYSRGGEHEYHQEVNGGKGRTEVTVNVDKNGHAMNASHITKLVRY